MSSAVVSPAEARPQPVFLLANLDVWPRLMVVCGVLIVLLLGAVIFAVSIGTTPIAHADVAEALVQYAGLDRGLDETSGTYRAVTLVRLPGVMMAAVVGAALACAGATMQGLFRNPLADPGIVGVSAGASLGVVLAVTQAAALSDAWRLNNGPLGDALWRLPVMAFGGAMLAALAVYGMSLQRGRINMAGLLLAGVALNSVLGAITSVLLLRTDDVNKVRTVLSWLVGSLEGRGWAYFDVVKWPILAAALIVMLYARDLNLLAIGEENAQSLGVNVPLVRLILLALSCLLTAAAVSFVGAIGFVGLVVPHMLRLMIGPDHRVLLPASFLGGAVFLVVADGISRAIIAPEKLQVGIVTALVGGPFFLFLLWRNRRQIAVF